MVLPKEPTGIRLTEGKLTSLIGDGRVVGIVLALDSKYANQRIEVSRTFAHYLDRIVTEGHGKLWFKDEVPKAYELSSLGIIELHDRDREGNRIDGGYITAGRLFGETRAIGVHRMANGLKRFFSKGTYHPIPSGEGERK